MSILEAIILGIVQGLTEFLPVSSSGHVLLSEKLFGIDQGAGFTAVIQLGTLAAVLIYFWSDIVRVAKSFFGGLMNAEGRTSPDYGLGWAVVVGTFPVAIAGLLFEDAIDNQFRTSMQLGDFTLRAEYLVAGMLIAVALIMWAAERAGKRTRELGDIGWKDGLIVGCWQALALIPGSSRSGSTIAGGLFLGLKRETAARFSFLLMIPAVGASGIYKLVKESETLLGSGVAQTAIATLAAFISGYWAIAFLMKFLQTRSTGIFIGYRIVLGAVIIALLSSGVM
jgi:undecaprenyl-diphosphatase